MPASKVPHHRPVAEIRTRLSRKRGYMELDLYTHAYRAAEVQQVMGWIKARQSDCLVDLCGAGKFNFVSSSMKMCGGNNWSRAASAFCALGLREG